MSKLNLLKLINSPKADPFWVEYYLGTVFPVVIGERTGSFRFFDREFTCFDITNRVRLRVQYGWHPIKGWMFDILAPSKNKRNIT